VSDETPVAVAEVPPHTFRDQYFKRPSHDLSGLPTALKAEMSRLVNRGPTPEMVARVKQKWASKRTQAW
jgi:hypothetical protein